MYNVSKIIKISSLPKLDNRGLGTIEIILILVVLIGLVIIFKDQLLELIERIFAVISNDSGVVLS